MRVVITEKKTEIRELPPEIARHFVKQRIFAVDDFVVREGKEEIFTEGVEKRERELVVLVLAVDGIGGEIFQRVIHPTHVPFEAETEPTEISGAGNAGPGSGFFGNGEDAGEPAVDDFVHALEESYGGEILPATEFVGNPFAGLAGIIEIEHGSNGVYPEAVDVVLVEPEESVGDETASTRRPSMWYLSSQKRALEMRKFWTSLRP